MVFAHGINKKNRKHDEKVATIRAMPIGPALLYFAIPAILFRLIIYGTLPSLLSLGLPAFWAFIITFSMPTGLLLIAALVAYAHEGNELSWLALRERFRLRSIKGRVWIWMLVGMFAALIATNVLSFTARELSRWPLFAPPDFFPLILNPNAQLSNDLFTNFMGVSLRGNWAVVIGYLVLLTLNIFGEEFWWRGLILPRQELSHGQWTWVIHGLLWALFHVPFYPWQIFALPPVTLIFSWIAQHSHNTTPVIILHYLFNGLVIIPILIGVLGLAG